MELSQEWFDIILLYQAIYILINGRLEKGLGKNRNSLLHSIGQADRQCNPSKTTPSCHYALTAESLDPVRPWMAHRRCVV